MTSIPHPERSEIQLGNVLASLGDDTRLAIIGHVARSETQSAVCASFHRITSKSNLTYHLGKLREAGVVRVVPQGTRRIVSLRRDDLDALFPGLLDSIIERIPPGFGAEALGEWEMTVAGDA